MHRHRRKKAFREPALLWDFFDYPATDVVDPYNTFVTRVQVGNAGDTTYNGTYDSIGYLGPDSTIVFYHNTNECCLFYNESEWRLGLNYDPPDEDFAYGSLMGEDIWGEWYPNTAVGAPTIYVGSVGHLSRKGGFGWGTNGWAVYPSCYDFGVKNEPLEFSKNAIQLKTGPKHMFSKLSPSPWPDVELQRDLNPAYMPSRLLTSSKLGKGGSVLYMAYVVEPISTIPTQRWFGVKHDGGCGWFGRNWNSSYWGMELKYGGGQQNSTTLISADVTHLIVQKQEWKPDSSKVLGSLWVDPTPATHPMQADPIETADINGADMTAWTFARIYLAFSQVAKFGSYRLGENFYDVAPGKNGLPD